MYYKMYILYFIIQGKPLIATTKDDEDHKEEKAISLFRALSIPVSLYYFIFTILTL